MKSILSCAGATLLATTLVTVTTPSLSGPSNAAAPPAEQFILKELPISTEKQADFDPGVIVAACGEGGDCYAQGSGVGCGDSACCSMVCQFSLACCTVAWDLECVEFAGAICGPVNDGCDGALALRRGVPQPFDLAQASVEDDGALCPLIDAATEADLWYRWTAPASGSAFIEMGGTDPQMLTLAVYATGHCFEIGLDAPLACGPASTVAEARFEVQFGGHYLIRLGHAPLDEESDAASMLAGSITVDLDSTCLADLDGDGIVDSRDVGLLLAAWGAPGAGDLDGDGTIGPGDLGVLIALWGPCAD